MIVVDDSVRPLIDAYRDWLELVADDEAGRRPADAVVLGTLSAIRALEAPLDRLARDAAWAIAQGKTSDELAVAGAPLTVGDGGHLSAQPNRAAANLAAEGTQWRTR